MIPALNGHYFKELVNLALFAVMAFANFLHIENPVLDNPLVLCELKLTVGH